MKRQAEQRFFFEANKSEIISYADANGIEYNGNEKLLFKKFNSYYKLEVSEAKLKQKQEIISKINAEIETIKAEKERLNLEIKIFNVKSKNKENQKIKKVKEIIKSKEK